LIHPAARLENFSFKPITARRLYYFRKIKATDIKYALLIAENKHRFKKLLVLAIAPMEDASIILSI